MVNVSLPRKTEDPATFVPEAIFTPFVAGLPAVFPIFIAVPLIFVLFPVAPIVVSAVPIVLIFMSPLILIALPLILVDLLEAPIKIWFVPESTALFVPIAIFPVCVVSVLFSTVCYALTLQRAQSRL